MNSSVNESVLTEEVQNKCFRTRYCERQRCPLEEFETRLFHQCLHLRARLLGWLVRRFRPHNFNSDYVFLRDAAMAKNSQELQAAITSYKLDCYRDSTFLHDTLKFRISCRKIKRIFTELASSKETIS